MNMNMDIKDRLLLQQAINKNTVQYSVYANFAQKLSHESTSIHIDNQRGLIIFKHKNGTVTLDFVNRKFIGLDTSDVDKLMGFLKFLELRSDGITVKGILKTETGRKKILNIFGKKDERKPSPRLLNDIKDGEED